jgi:hypothetical protein
MQKCIGQDRNYEFNSYFPEKEIYIIQKIQFMRETLKAEKINEE